MQILVWIFLGLVSGGIVASLMHERKKYMMFVDIILGGVGSLIAGILTYMFTLQNVAGLYDETILLSVVGATFLIWLGRTILTRNSS